uniref:Putative LOV domain-containing protein n=1 Tax=Conocephalum conicum TaxID=41839 RepID=A0A126WY23_CONCI|nr:putative LOV domain-containing protein [Conocephalum conicum]
MPDACSRSVDVLEQLHYRPNKGEMQTKNATSPSPFHRKLLGQGPLEKRAVSGRVEKPAATVPHTGFSRDARGSLEIFGTSVQRGTPPVFSSHAWHDALETAENLLLMNNSPCHTVSSFGDESEASSSEKSGSTLWKTKSRSQPSVVPKSLPRPRAFNRRAKATVSPVSITLEYGGSDHEFSLDNDSDDVELALPVSTSSVVSMPRKVPLTPHNTQPAVAVYEEPVDIEEQWQSMLNGTAWKAKREVDFAENKGDERWQGVLDGGVGGPVSEDYDGAESRRGRSVGGLSEVSDDVRSERALQWGYGVPLRTSTEFGDGASTVSWRASTVSSESRSSGGSNGSQTIPGVAKDVRDAITSFNLAFVVCDAFGTDPSYPVLYASGGFFKMTGYEADEVIGSNCGFLQGPGTDPKEVAKIRKALEAGKNYSGKILNYKKDGTSFWNVLSISPIRNNEGKVIKYIGMQAEASEKRKKEKVPKEEIPLVAEVITEIPKHVPISEASKPAEAARAFEGYIPELSLPPLKDSIESLPRISYRYSLSKSRQSNESADWHALARLRADIVSSARSLESTPEIKEDRREKDKSGPRTTRVARLFRKLNTKISERLRTPEVEYVDCENEDLAFSTVDESDIERRRRSSLRSRSSIDFRLATPSDFGKLDIPERSDRLSSSHCAIPSVTHAGRSQFVIIH